VGERGTGDLARGLSLGYLAMLPLFAAYEWALVAQAGARRNTAELLGDLALRPLAERAAYVRWAVLALAAPLALWSARRRGARVRAGVARIVLEGAAFALLLGPLLVAAMAALGDVLPKLDVSWSPVGAAPGGAQAALVFGGAAWEELVFRVGAYSALFVLARRLALGTGLAGGASRALAELAGLCGSSLAFALLHFEACSAWLGGGGLEFDPALFTWLALAGILLGLLFRLRGPGVAAWTHGLFNLALWIGIDPDVLA